MSDRYTANVTPEGRVLIPAALRRAAGLEPGASVSLRLQDGEIVVTSPDVARRQLKEMFSGIDHSLADELIAERHAEAAADNRRLAPARRPRGRGR